MDTFTMKTPHSPQTRAPKIKHPVSTGAKPSPATVLRWAGDVEVVSPGRLRERMRILGEEHARMHPSRPDLMTDH
jgi:hypothetical protein